MNTTFKPSLESWKSILSISSRFKMTKLRTRVIDEITTFHPHIDPVDKIVLGVQYDVSKWLSPGYAALVRRETPLERHEARKLGVDTMCLIAKAREGYRGTKKAPAPAPMGLWGNTVPDPFTARMKDDDDVVNRLIQDIFWPVPATPIPTPLPDVSDVRRFFTSSSSAC